MFNNSPYHNVSSVVNMDEQLMHFDTIRCVSLEQMPYTDRNLAALCLLFDRNVVAEKKWKIQLKEYDHRMQSLYYTKKYNSRVSERFYVEATAALIRGRF